jgi:hypothetical protein
VWQMEDSDSWLMMRFGAAEVGMSNR